MTKIKTLTVTANKTRYRVLVAKLYVSDYAPASAFGSGNTYNHPEIYLSLLPVGLEDTSDNEYRRIGVTITYQRDSGRAEARRGSRDGTLGTAIQLRGNRALGRRRTCGRDQRGIARGQCPHRLGNSRGASHDR